MAEKVFIHGVPDTPAIWSPLLNALRIKPSQRNVPDLPGFTRPPPAGFKRTKEDYVDWLIAHLETISIGSGPVDLVAHDWGGLLALRAISLRPDLIRSWAVMSAVPHPGNLWHSTAKKWQTPVLGELIMMLSRPKYIEGVLRADGVPDELARHEAGAFGPQMKASILQLYRSAKTLGTDWYPRFENLPPNGLILWGETDRFGPAKMGQVFAQQFDLPFILIEKTGHWSFVEKPHEIAQHLTRHWAEVT